MKNGVAGIDQTVDAMARVSMGQYGAGSMRIRSLAIQIIRAAGVDEKNQLGEVRAIHQWVMDRLRYVKDPAWYEMVTFPETLAFEQPDGDCDDHAVLEAALLGAIGIPSRFVVFGFKGGGFSHVALQAMLPKGPLPLDPIVKNKPAGWEVPDWTSRKIYTVSTPTGVAPGMWDLAIKIAAVGGAVALGVGMLARLIQRLPIGWGSHDHE